MTTAVTIKVGDIFSRSWGYDQTNVNYYQVVKVSPSGKTLTFREIGKAYVDDNQTSCVPVKDAFVREDHCAKCSNHLMYHDGSNSYQITSHAFTTLYVKRLSKYSATYVKWNSYSGASLWDGKPEYVTGPYGGH
jgi:hypothetical protein